MLKVLDSAFNQATSLKDKASICQSSISLMSFGTPNDQDVNIILRRLKMLEQDSKSDGLLLMHTLVVQCTQEVLQENVVSWAKSIFQVLQGSESCSSKELACSILQIIMERLPVHMKKDFADAHLQELIQILISTTEDDEWITKAIKCLCVCISTFTSLCVPYKADIERFLVLQLDCNLTREIEPIAECFSQLPKLSERSSSSPAQYAKCWSELIQKLLATLNMSFQYLFESCPTEDDSEALTLTLPPESEDPWSSRLCWVRRFQAISRCISKLLSTQTLHEVEIPISKLFCTINAALSVSFEQLLSHNNAESTIVASNLTVIYTSALVMLESVIISCHETVNMFESNIGALLGQLLHTDMCDNQDNGCSLLKCAIYRILRSWIEKCSPDLKYHIHVILQYLMNDIKPYLPNCWMQPMSSRHSSSSSSEKVNRILKCTGALQVLCSMLYCHCEVGGDILEKIQRAVLDIVFTIQKYPEFPSPYDNESCRVELYRLFLSTIICAPQTSSPLPIALKVLRAGCQDTSIEVSAFCHQAVAMCTFILHPIRPEIRYPVAFEETKMNDLGLVVTETTTRQVRSPLLTNLKPIIPVQNHIQDHTEDSLSSNNAGPVLTLDAESVKYTKNQGNSEEMIPHSQDLSQLVYDSVVNSHDDDDGHDLSACLDDEDMEEESVEEEEPAMDDEGDTDSDEDVDEEDADDMGSNQDNSSPERMSPSETHFTSGPAPVANKKMSSDKDSKFTVKNKSQCRDNLKIINENGLGSNLSEDASDSQQSWKKYASKGRRRTVSEDASTVEGPPAKKQEIMQDECSDASCPDISSMLDDFVIAPPSPTNS